MAGGAAGPRARDLDDLASRWPHVRRAADDVLLQRALEGDTLLLVGEAGAGKTALAAQIHGALRSAGAHVVEMAATESTRDPPLGALRRAIAPPEGMPIDQLLGWALRNVPAAAGDKRLVLGVDDAHHLDPVSAALVHQLVASGAGSAVITARHDEDLPDAIALLERDGIVRRSTLASFATDEVAVLLREALGTPATASTVRRLTEATGGNPLHLRELCAHGVARGALRPRAGWWSWNGPVRAAGDLRRMLLERIADLDASSRRAVELLAFAPGLGMDACEALVGTEVVHALENRRLVTVDRAGRRDEVRLAHPLFGEVVRERCGPSAGELQAQLADAVEAHGCRRATDLQRVVEWRLSAGQQVDPQQLIAAAERAWQSHEYALSERCARAAVDAGGGPMASLALGSVLAEGGRVGEAEQVWAAMDVPAGDPCQVQLNVLRASNLFFGLHRAAAAAALLEDATELATTVAELEQIAVKRAMLCLYGGDPAGARAAAAPVVDRSESPYRRRTAAVFLGPALAVEGRAEDAVAVLDRALADSGVDAESLNLTGELLAGRVLALLLAGRLTESRTEAAGLKDLSSGLGVEKGVAVFGLAAGHAALALGRIDEALAELEDAAVLLRRLDRNGYLPWCLGELAHARTLAGDVDGAMRAIREADAVKSPAFRLFDCRMELARARLLAASGRSAEAERVALDAGRRSATAGQRPFAAQALHEAVRLGVARTGSHGLDNELRAVASGTDSLLAPVLADHADAARSADGVALADVARSLDGLGATVHAAEALQLAAEAHLRAGARAEALGCALGARALAESCPGAAIGWLGPLPALDLLSNRELDVARRVASGLTDKEVADELFVSVRTVQNHLHRTYAKLGIRGRAELGTSLGASEWRVAHDRPDSPSYVPL